MDTPTTSTTPVTTTEPSPAAPATSAPTQSVTTSERPKTFAEAFAKDAAGTDPLTTSTEPAAIAPSVSAEPPSATPPQDNTQGPIPYEVHIKAMENRGAKEVERALGEVRQKLPSLDVMLAKPQVVEKGMAHFQKIDADPAGHWLDWTAEMLAHPVHGPLVRSNLARTFGGLRQQQVAAQTMPPPDVDIVDAQGTVTGKTYSADQLEKRDAWREARSREQAAQTAKQQQVAETKAAEAKQHVEARADEAMAEVIDILDGDKTHLAAVIDVMNANPSWSAHRAALDVRKTRITPAAAGKAQAQVLEDLKTKAAAQSVNPAHAVIAPTTKPRSFLDPSLKW